jgi:putative glutamine amidotransferase
VEASQAAAELDGLLLPGGDDFPPPAPYPAGVAFHLVADEQLAFDAALLDEALGRGLPVLGICYGMQLLARHHGAALLYDIETDRPGALPHRAGGGDAHHPLQVEGGTRLAAILDATAVNSRHHQAVAEAGQGLRVSARAPDGIIEAVEAADGRFLIGVQWHPESQDDAASRRLFRAFVQACSEAAGRRR